MMIEFCETAHMEGYSENLAFPVGEGKEGRKRSRTALHVILVRDECTSICVFVLLICATVVLMIVLTILLRPRPSQ